MSALLIAARFFHEGALNLLFGALLFPYYAFAGLTRATVRVSLIGQGALLTAALIGLVSGGAWYAAVAAGMAGDPAGAVRPDVLLLVARSTDFGWLWLSHLAVLALLAVTLNHQHRAGFAALNLCLAAIALASLAVTGHAREGIGAPALFHGASDIGHLLCAGLWLGALPCLIVLLMRAEHRHLASTAVSRFSTVATPAVGVLVLTGIANALLLLSSPRALLTTGWGQLLLVKVALVLVMCSLAAINRWRMSPQLAAGSSSRQLARNAVIELALAAVVIALVAIIGTLSPMQVM